MIKIIFIISALIFFSCFYYSEKKLMAAFRQYDLDYTMKFKEKIRILKSSTPLPDKFYKKIKNLRIVSKISLLIAVLTFILLTFKNYIY